MLKINPGIELRSFINVAVMGAVLRSVYQQEAYFNALFIVLGWEVNVAVYMLCSINIVLVI